MSSVSKGFFPEKIRRESLPVKNESEKMPSTAHSSMSSRNVTQSPTLSHVRSGHGILASRGDTCHNSAGGLPPIIDRQPCQQTSKNILTKLKSIKERDERLASKSPNKQIIKKYESEGGPSFISFIQNATAVRSTANGVLYYQRKMGTKNEELESKMAHAKDWFVDKPVEIAREIRLMRPLTLQEECGTDVVFLTATSISGEYLDPLEVQTPERIDLRTTEFTNSNVLRALPQIGDKNRRNHVIERLSIDKEAYRPPPPPPPPPPHPLCSLFTGILQREGMRLPRKWLISELASTSGVELIPDGFAEPFVENLNRIMEVYMNSNHESDDGEALDKDGPQHVSLIRIMDNIFEDFRIGQNLENKAFIYKVLYWLPQFVTVARAPCNGNLHPSRFLWGAFSLICICTSSTLFNKSGKRLPTLQEVCLQTSAELLQLLKHMRLDDDVYVQNVLDSCEQKFAPKRNFSCSQSLVGTPRESITSQTLPSTQLMIDAYKELCLSENHAPINQVIAQMTNGKSREDKKLLTLNGYLGGDKCIEQLCTFITVSSDSLETLDLRRNAISGDGVEGLKHVILKLSKLRSLFLDNNCLGKKGAFLMAEAMKLMCVPSKKSNSTNADQEGQSQALGLLANEVMDREGVAVITLSWNGLLDSGCAKICRAGLSCPALTSLDISGNKAANQTGNAIGDLLERSSSLVELRAEWNLFRGKGAAAIASGLISSCSLTHAYLAWNNFGDVNACASLGHALSVNSRLLYLNLTKNQINGRGAALIAEGLAENRNLQTLILDENPLGAVGGRLLIRASPKLNKERELSMLNCNAASATSAVKDSAVFDPSQPTGTYELDMAESYSHIVLKHLLMFVDKNTGIFATQPELEGKRWNPPSAKDLQDEKVKLPDKGILSFKFEMHRTKPAEDDSLNNTDMIMIERLFQLAARGSDREALIFMITSGGTFIKSEHVAFLFQKYMKTPQEQVQLVTKCMFRLLDSDAKDSLIDMLSPEAFAIFKRTTSQYTRLFTPNNPTGRYKLDMSQETDYELFMTLLNLRDIAHREILRRHKAGRPGDLPCNKAAPPEYVFINLKYDAENIELPSSHWNPERRGLLEFDYVEANHPSELCPIASEQEVAQFYAPGSILRQQYKEKQEKLNYEMEVKQFKLEVERKQKNAEQNIEAIDQTDIPEDVEKYKIMADDDDNDIVSVSISDGSKSAAQSRPQTSESESTKFTKPLKNNKAKIDLLSVEKFEDWEPHVYKALRALCNEKCLYLKDACDIISQLKDSALKVESAICLLRRVRDWHGFEHTVFKRLSKSERIEFSRRVGSHNMYDEVCAVGYYELDLNNAGDRYIMGQLTRLAVLEPGENMVDETYGGINFELPAGWCTETPNRGDYTTYYCREARTIEKNRLSVPEWTIPPNFSEIQPPLVKWVEESKRGRIKWKLAEKFANGEDCFSQLDKDGGGSLGRVEIAVGLRSVGVWLTPNELTELMVCLDEDGSGSVEIDELVEFWNKY